MSEKQKKPQKLRARLPRGLGDRDATEIAATRRMTEVIREVYERYGFEPVETPAMEFTDALGKFLPDQDRPNEGVFSFQDDDEQWISLRYDLTAPLARYVAENWDALPKPYRSYRAGYVFRNEKPGPGRFRQFMQFDADTVGSASPAADAEMCMMAADAMEALGIPRGQYVVKVNNRKVLDGVMEASQILSDRRLVVLRALDKYDRLGLEGVMALLDAGRKDESGDFTAGAMLNFEQKMSVTSVLTRGNTAEYFKRVSKRIIESDKPLANLKNVFESEDELQLSARKTIEDLFHVIGLSTGGSNSTGRAIRDDDLRYRLAVEGEVLEFQVDNLRTIQVLKTDHKDTQLYQEGVGELEQIARIVDSAGYGSGRILIDPSVVRGLEYYTGAVFEVELLLEAKDDKGRPVRFGSVGGGGRYDGLVSRFRGEPVPATGFSIGVSRLQAALTMLGKLDSKPAYGPVVVTVFGGDIADYQKMVAMLRNAGIRAELYLGNPKHSLSQQVKYADRRNSPCVITQGSDEKAAGTIQINDLIAGAGIAEIADRDEYLRRKAASLETVAEADLVAAVRAVLAKHDVKWG